VQYEISPQKILRHPMELALLKTGGLRPSVLNVEVDFTAHCNARCPSCDFPAHYYHNMDVETFHATLGALVHTWGTRAVVLTGGGEPTIHPAFSRYVRELTEKRLEVGLYTNGIYRPWVLDDLQFAWVYVSLDACTPEQWGVAKGLPERVFQTVLDTIGIVSSLAVCGVGFLIGDDNSDDIVAMARLANEHGAHYADFRPRWPVEIEDWERVMRNLHTAERHYGAHVPWERWQDAQSWVRGYSTCWASMFLRQVDAEGRVWVCPTTRWLRELGTVPDCTLDAPVLVNDLCRPLCRGHGMNRIIEKIMQKGPHDNFV
jgi:MoaA/NifB/PqqE/SkfB family radical SAM enzyme